MNRPLVPHPRERLHANLGGMAALVAITSLVLIAACAVCPDGGIGCPQFPINYEPGL